MEIINTIYKDGEITINFDSDSSVGIKLVYLDGISNRDNIYSEAEEDHEYIITTFECGDAYIVIDATEYCNTFFIVTVVTEGGNMLQTIAIDSDSIYREKVLILTDYCSTCLDKHLKEVIVMCLFYSQLLEYTVEKNMLTNAMDHFVDLARLLDLPDTHECAKCKKGRKCSSCIKHYSKPKKAHCACQCCSNGCCAL